MNYFKIWVTVSFLNSTVCAFAADPSWWSNGATAFVDPDPSAPHSINDNYAPANVGQLKNVATKARDYLEGVLPNPGADTFINTMVGGFTHNSGDYDVLNIGQLKAVAEPFYARLRAVGFNTNANLIIRGYPTTWTDDYPWNRTAPVPTMENYAPVTIGQLKMVFSFNLGGLTENDANGNDLDDAWEMLWFGNLFHGGNEDYDGDGLSNVYEMYIGTNPASTDTNFNEIPDGTDPNPVALPQGDSDGDIISDSWELKFGPNSTVDNNAEDPDGDGMGRTLEFLACRSSAISDSPVDSTDRALDIF